LKINEFFSFFPPSHEILIQDLDKADTRLILSVWCRRPAVENPEIEIFSCLIPKATGERVPVGAKVVSIHKKEGLDCLLLDVQLGDLAPGDYDLEIEAVESQTGSSARIQKPITVR
jgi:hypothetical protein